jgi:ABC-type Fe3+/spermidine/putrescine transport system ATPase subunit
MGDNNIIRGRVTESENGRVVLESDDQVRVTASTDGVSAPPVGGSALVSIRAAAVRLDDSGDGAAGNSAECEIVFVEFLGDLVKLHLTAGGERMLAKVPGDRYPALRGKEGEKIRISWKEEDVQLLQS